jgi:thiol-disulfide isomerase/thioredoxin
MASLYDEDVYLSLNRFTLKGIVVSLYRQRFLRRVFSSVPIPSGCVAWGLSALIVIWSGIETVHARSGPHGGHRGDRASVYDRAGDWSLHTLDGKALSFSECKGKMVFLNFWATWCKPCIAEMAGIEKLKRDMKDENMVFLMVTEEAEETVRAFLKKHPIKLPVYRSGKGAPKMFKPRKFPYTLIIDKDGNIVFRRTGSMEWDQPACRDLIRGFMPARET